MSRQRVEWGAPKRTFDGGDVWSLTRPVVTLTYYRDTRRWSLEYERGFAPTDEELRAGEALVNAVLGEGETPA